MQTLLELGLIRLLWHQRFGKVSFSFSSKSSVFGDRKDAVLVWTEGQSGKKKCIFKFIRLSVDVALVSLLPRAQDKIDNFSASNQIWPSFILTHRCQFLVLTKSNAAFEDEIGVQFVRCLRAELTLTTSDGVATCGFSILILTFLSCLALFDEWRWSAWIVRFHCCRHTILRGEEVGTLGRLLHLDEERTES